MISSGLFDSGIADSTKSYHQSRVGRYGPSSEGGPPSRTYLRSASKARVAIRSVPRMAPQSHCMQQQFLKNSVFLYLGPTCTSNKGFNSGTWLHFWAWPSSRQLVRAGSDGAGPMPTCPVRAPFALLQSHENHDNGINSFR